MKTTMLAARVYNQNDLRLEQVPVPQGVARFHPH